MPMFGVVCSQSRFLRQFVNFQFEYYFVLFVGPTGTRNQKTRPPTDSFRCHKRDGGLRILKRASIKNHIFQSKPLDSIFVELL